MSSEAFKQVQYTMSNTVVPRSAIGTIYCSIGVLAYNEEANIRRNLQVLLAQDTIKASVSEIIVIASGCTDNTIPIVREMMQLEPRLQLIVQDQPEGKVSAINAFLQQAHSPILVVMGADIIPDHDVLEKLCLHFSDPDTGMVGARSVPVNEENTFIGHAVHLQRLLQDRLARREPKLGGVIAFRNVIQHIPSITSVNEIAIQAAIARLGLNIVYEPDAVIYDKGPLTVIDFLQQSRRIHAGRLKIRAQEGYLAPTMKILPLLKEVQASASYIMTSPLEYFWTAGAIALECIARALGRLDVLLGRPDHKLRAIHTVRAKDDANRKMRRICNAQSVIVIHIALADPDSSATSPITDDPLMPYVMHKLLPALRRSLRRDDILSISGANTIVAVFNGDQRVSDLISARLIKIITTQHIALHNKPPISLMAISHAVSVGQ